MKNVSAGEIIAALKNLPDPKKYRGDEYRIIIQEQLRPERSAPLTIYELKFKKEWRFGCDEWILEGGFETK
jgi:hypothetical protein